MSRSTMPNSAMPRSVRPSSTMETSSAMPKSAMTSSAKPSRPSTPSQRSTSLRKSRPARRSRPARLAGFLLATALVTVACAEALPQLQEPEALPGPILSQEQSQHVLDSINAALSAATASHDPDLLQGRVTGPALTVRTSQLLVASILGSDDLVTDLPDSQEQVILTTTHTWPRTSFAITSRPEDMQPQRLIALEQNSAREDYQMWAWVQLLPGITMPQFAHPQVGSPEVAPDDDSLVVAPQDAVAQYADLLMMGQMSVFTDNFQPLEEDPLRSFMAEWTAAQEAVLSAERVEGTHSLSVTPLAGAPIRAVRTESGGAMVMAALSMSEQMQAVEGAYLEPSTQTALALLEGQERTNQLSAQYIDMIALYIPAAGSDQPISLLGYTHVQIGASVH